MLLEIFKTLREKYFITEVDCFYQPFLRAVSYIRKPPGSDCGTCSTCLNPELKIESLVHKQLMDKIDLQKTINVSDDFQNLFKSIYKKYIFKNILI